MFWSKLPLTRLAVISACGAMIALFNLGAKDALAQQIRIMAFGDSLTAGFGLDHQESFPAQLEQSLKADGYDVVVLNAGVSGDTTAGGLARVDWALGDNPQLVILELGANDALRGLEPRHIQNNLERIIEAFKARNVPVVLAGMLAPPNYGKEYEAAFGSIYPALARKYDLAFYPFFLEGVAARPELNLPDKMHPTAKGVGVIVERIKPLIVTQLKDLITQPK